MDEGKEDIERDDAVQASEKLYKAAEESIKVLSKARAPEICKEAVTIQPPSLSSFPSRLIGRGRISEILRYAQNDSRVNNYKRRWKGGNGAGIC